MKWLQVRHCRESGGFLGQSNFSQGSPLLSPRPGFCPWVWAGFTGASSRYNKGRVTFGRELQEPWHSVTRWVLWGLESIWAKPDSFHSPLGKTGSPTGRLTASQTHFKVGGLTIRNALHRVREMQAEFTAGTVTFPILRLDEADMSFLLRAEQNTWGEMGKKKTSAAGGDLCQEQWARKDASPYPVWDISCNTCVSSHWLLLQRLFEFLLAPMWDHPWWHMHCPWSWGWAPLREWQCSPGMARHPAF